jgi:hypothetical protein
MENETAPKRMKRSEMRDDADDAMRPDARALQREEDPRARAERRAAEIRKHNEGASTGEADRFFIDPRMIPDGWSYEWKRKTLWGKEDTAHDVEMSRLGWEAVPVTRHPELMPKGNFQTIERDGMILMERPKVLTDEAHAANLRRARQQVRAKEAQLSQSPDGTLPRDEDARTRPVIKKSYEAMPISEE